MTWQSYDTWVVITGALCAMACALPGAQLVLRRRSMMSEAISHAVLPGVAIAFLITATNDPLVMLAGAVLIGILTTVLVDAWWLWQLAEDELRLLQELGEKPVSQLP